MTVKRSAALVAVLLLGATVWIGCPVNPTTFQVTFPVNSQDFNVNASNQIEMTVRFNRPVDFGTIIAGTNVTVDTDTTTNANITVNPGGTANEIIIVTDDTVANLLTFDPDGFFTLTISGNSPNAVQSQAGAGGQNLDGDANGTPGGNFVHQYTMLG